MDNEVASKKALALVIVVLVVVTVLPYWGVRDHGFLQFDDDIYVTKNPHVLTGLTSDNVAWAFRLGAFSMWHPLTWITHMMDIELYGENGGGHHTTNLVLHVAATVVLFMALAHMTGSLWAPALVALLFGVHPLHVESVAWIAERKDVLSGFFWMLVLWAYSHYGKKGGVGWYVAAACFLSLGLLAKPMLVTLPFVLLLLDVWPLNRLDIESEKPAALLKKFGKLAVEKIPLIAIVVAASVMAFLSQQRGGAVADLELYPFWVRLCNASIAYSTYLMKTVWPSGLAVYYPHPGLDVSVGKALVSAVFLMGVTIAVLWKFRSHPYAAVGWFWYLGALVPVIGIVQVGGQALADRYTYIPLVGVFIMLAWWGETMVARYGIHKAALPVGGAALVLIFAVATWVQVLYWRDDVALFGRTLEVTGDNYLAQNHYGLALSKSGQEEKAIPHFLKAMEINPGHVRSRVNLGNSLMSLGQTDASIRAFQDALRIKPDHAPAHVNLGKVLFQVRRMAPATRHLTRAVELAPEDAIAHNNLGAVLAAQGRFEEALVHFQRALQLKPGYVSAQHNIERALQVKRQRR